MRKLLLGGILLGTGLLGFVPQAVRAASPPDTVIIARNLDTTYTFDPQEFYEIAPSEIVNSLYVRLITLDNETFSKIVPGAAKSWSVSDDGLTYTFKIDGSQKFQSGRPVTAEDAAFSLQRGILRGTPQTFILSQFGWTKDNVKEKVLVDGGDLVIKLDKRYARDLVLNALTTGIASIVDKTEVLSHEKDGDLGNAWLRTNSAGSGAYRLVSYRPKEAVVLQANPNFYLGAPKTKNIIVRHVAEPAAQRLLLEKGDVDIAEDLTPDQADALASNKDVKIQRIQRGTTFYFALNQRHPILAKPEVREAFRWLIDYNSLSKDLFNGYYGITQAFLAPGVNGSLPGMPYSYDPEKAKALLAKAGYPEGFRLTLDAYPTTPLLPASQAIQASFAKVGVVLDIQVGEPLKVLTNYRQGKHDFIMFVKSVDYNDPAAMASYFAREDKNAPKVAIWNNWSIPDLTAKTDAAAVEQDPVKRQQLYTEIQQRIQTDSPFIFALREISRIATRGNVSGFRAGATFDSGIFYLIRKEPVGG